MKKAYIATFVLKHPTEPDNPLVVNFFVVAGDEASAIKRGRENLSEAEFLSDTRNWEILRETAGFVGEEHIEEAAIEEAAIEVLGWKPPADL